MLPNVKTVHQIKDCKSKLKMYQKYYIFTERLSEKPLTSSWPKELKLQEIEGEKDDQATFDDDEDDDDDYFDYEDDEDDEYDDEEEEEYDDDYYDDDFFKDEVFSNKFIEICLVLQNVQVVHNRRGRQEVSLFQTEVVYSMLSRTKWFWCSTGKYLQFASEVGREPVVFEMSIFNHRLNVHRCAIYKFSQTH